MSVGRGYYGVTSLARSEKVCQFLSQGDDGKAVNGRIKRRSGALPVDIDVGSGERRRREFAIFTCQGNGEPSQLFDQVVVVVGEDVTSLFGDSLSRKGIRAVFWPGNKIDDEVEEAVDV